MNDAANLPARALSRMPRQERAIQSVHRILDAAMEVLLEEGPEALTTNRVAARAPASIGTVYQYFAHKDAILSGIVERGVLSSQSAIAEVVGAAAHQVGLEELIISSLETVIELLEPHRPLLRALFTASPGAIPTTVVPMMEAGLTALAKATWLAPVGGYTTRHGSATLWIVNRTAVLLVLAWLIEAPDVPRESFARAYATTLLSGLRPV